VVVSIVDCEQKFSWLWKESSDLTIVPSRKDWFTIRLEENAVAFKSGNFNSEKFLSGLGVPDSDIVQRGGSEEFRVASRESNVVDSFIMACVSQFWGDLISVAPVDGSLGSTAEEMGLISSQGDWCNGSHNLSLFLHEHILRSNLGKSSISWTEKEVSVG